MSTPALGPAGTKGLSGIVSGTVLMPSAGAWVADLVVDRQEAIAGKVDLRLSANLTLKGSVSRAGVAEGLLRARVVAGGDGLRKAVKPRHYTSPTIRVVLRDITGDVGETLSDTADAAILGTQLPHWTTLRMPAAQAICCLLPLASGDVAWRILPDGNLWVGRETWASSTVLDINELADLPEEAVRELTMLHPELLPGRTFEGQRIDTLEVRIDGARVRATAWMSGS